MKPTPEERLLAKLVRSRTRFHDGVACLEWIGAKASKNYGKISVEGRLVPTHRLAYTLWVGPIAPGLEIDHLCENSLCSEPRHLEPVTHLENVRRASRGNAKKTHCKRGHEFTNASTGWQKGSSGMQRRCKICDAFAHRPPVMKHGPYKTKWLNQLDTTRGSTSTY